MVYLFILIYITLYLFILNKYLIFNKKFEFILYLPPAYIYWLFLAIQYNVGTDYFSYYNMIKEGIQPHIIYNHEYLFYFILKFIQYFDLDPQFIFVIVGFINTLLFFLILIKYKKYGFKPWIFFYLFMTVTTIYFNQMNTLRQFIAVMLVPLLVIYIYEKKFFKSIIVSIMGLMFHYSFIIPIIILFFIWMLNKIKLYLIFLFIIIPIVLIYIFPHFADYIVSNFFPNYKYFLLKKNENVLKFLTKIYYIPLFLYFLYIWNFKKYLKTVNINFMNFLIKIFVYTYSLYLIDLTLPLEGRIFQYFIFFYIFPIYYIIEYFIGRKQIYKLFMVLIYITLPFLVKILIFPIGEYNYQSILF